MRPLLHAGNVVSDIFFGKPGKLCWRRVSGTGGLLSLPVQMCDALVTVPCKRAAKPCRLPSISLEDFNFDVKMRNSVFCRR